MQKLPAIMRVLGAGALIVAMYSFLARGWQSGNDVLRYLMMLGHTGLLAAIGLASGHFLKEGKGARLLISLALVSVPANFAILGAFIYSQTAMDATAYYPQYVAWMVDSLPIALMTTAGALAVLIPITRLGFSVLARSMSARLSWLFMLSNLALLIPLRSPQVIALLVAGLTVGVVWFSRRTSADQVSARTSEGVLAIALQLLPIGVLLVRTLWLHDPSMFLGVVMAGTLYAVLRQTSLYLQPGSRMRGLLDGLSFVPAFAMAFLLTAALTESHLLVKALCLPLGGLASAWMTYDIANRREQGHGYRLLAVTILLGTNALNLVIFNGVFASLASMATGFLMVFLGNREQQASLIIGGAVLTLAGLVDQIFDLLQHFDLGSWASMAILGIASIVIASVLESKGKELRNRITNWKDQLVKSEK